MKIVIGSYPDHLSHHIAQAGDPKEYPYGLLYESPPMPTRELAVLDAWRWALDQGHEPVFARLADWPLAGPGN